jgi:uncharacterized membrane protein
MLYLSLKLAHIILAILAVGFSIAYGLVIGRARRLGGTDGRELKFALRTVRFMDDKIAGPSYLLLLITGIGMVQVAGYPWSLKWIHGSMALLFVLVAIALGLYGPTQRKQLAALEARGPQDPEFIRLSKRGGMLGGVLGLIVIAILYLMVFKPA